VVLQSRQVALDDLPPLVLVRQARLDAAQRLCDRQAFVIEPLEAAVDFVKFLTSAANQQTLAKQGALLPPVKGALSAVTDPNLQAVAQLVGNAPYYQLYYDQFMSPAVGNTVNDQAQALFAGSTTPQAAAAAIDAAAASGG